LPNEALAREWLIFEGEDVTDAWLSTLSRIGELGLVTPDTQLQRWLHQAESVIFEGAQGVLLDAGAGFYPYTSWSQSTAANAYELIQEMAPDTRVFQFGVMRSYAVVAARPAAQETDDLPPLISSTIYNEWQAGSVMMV
jgi:adenylosuccinate synthase